jgi:DNA topoisomerase-3
MGRPFAALLRITDEFKLEFDFGQKDDEDAEAVDFTGQTPLGACPKCGGRVFEHGMNYVCEHSVGPGKSCTFRSGKIILQQEIPAAQMTQLLATGKTDLFQGFVSSRTNRKFKAYLVRQKDGKIGFEFEARPAKAGDAKSAKTSKAPAAKAAAQPAATASRPARAKSAGKTTAKSTPAAARKPARKAAAKKPAATDDDAAF